MPELATEATEELSATHAQGCTTIRGAGYVPENLETAIEVERHRWYFKPKRIKLVLVAESHVLTTEQDMRIKVDELRLRPFLHSGAILPPDRFVRLVYCLAYGENELLNPQPYQADNYGTPLFWDILGRVSFRSPQPRQEDGAEFEDRMRWKIDTLRQLYRMGIWLLDGSVHAIYRRGERLPAEIQQELHKQWWSGYGQFLMRTCGSPKAWIIGKTVHNCLPQDVFTDLTYPEWVYQPNARNVNLNRNWPQLLEDCWELRPSQQPD